MKPYISRLHFLFRPIAIFLSLLLVVTNSSVYAKLSPDQISNAPSPAPQILIPEAFGRIKESLVGASGKTIVYIQDAHDSLEAQENIARIINHLVEHNGVKTVYEEGYEGPVPTDQYFSFVKNPALKKKISYFLMDKLRLGGAEYAHVNRKKDFRLIGADSIKLHLENIRQYQESAKHKAETEKDLDAIGSEIKRLADQHFPKELKEWMKLKERFDEGKLDLLTYLRRILALKTSLMIPVHITFLLQAEAGKDQQAQAVKKIDPKVLFREIDFLENALANDFLKNDRDRKIFQHYKSIGLLKRLSNIRLSPDEYELVKTTLQELKTENFARSIVEITGKSIVLSKRWEQNIQNAIRFYEIAESRDQLVAKSLDTFLASPDEKLALMVFGGFHKNRLQDILKRKHISCLTVSPKITAISELHQRYYQQLMSVGYLPFEFPLTVQNAAPAARIFERVSFEDFPPYLSRLPENIVGKKLLGLVGLRSELRTVRLDRPQILQALQNDQFDLVRQMIEKHVNRFLELDKQSGYGTHHMILVEALKILVDQAEAVDVTEQQLKFIETYFANLRKKDKLFRIDAVIEIASAIIKRQRTKQIGGVNDLESIKRLNHLLRNQLLSGRQRAKIAQAEDLLLHHGHDFQSEIVEVFDELKAIIFLNGDITALPKTRRQIFDSVDKAT